MGWDETGRIVFFGKMVQTAATPAALAKLGDEMMKKTEKMSAEVFILTYGAFVSHLVHDLDSLASVNTALMKSGVQIGYRLIEDFLAQAMPAASSAGIQLGECRDFRETIEWIRVAFRVYLGTSPSVRQFSEDGKECTLVFEDGNPLMEFVELPVNLQPPQSKDGQHDGLIFSNLLAGVVKGALEMVQVQVECEMVQEDQLDCLRVRLIKLLEEESPPNED
jgi:trafficking protein particle complex subunit 3